MKVGVRIAALVLAMFVAAGCASAEPSPTRPPVDLGGTWTAILVAGRAPLPHAGPRVQFTDDQRHIQGTTGCNDFGAGILIDGDRISVRELNQTDIACPGAAGDVEAAFLAALRGAERIARDGNTLVLAGPAGELRFGQGRPDLDPEARAIAEALTSGEWRVARAAGLADPTLIPVIEFRNDHVVTIGECGFGGRYELLGGKQVRFSEIGWDAIPCDQAREAARDVVARLLESTSRVDPGADGRTVTFTGAQGELVLTR